VRRKPFAASIVGALLLLFATERAKAAPDDEIYARPGQVVAAGDGARLNLYCMGSGSPTVVFDSGWEDWAPAWAVVQPLVAKFTRACSYDRAGAGFSDPGPMPRTSVRLARELHTALRNGGIPGPYILVGNAFGGDPARTFAQLYMADTAGLVMAEADPSDVEPRAMQAEDHRGTAKFLPRVPRCGRGAQTAAAVAAASGTAAPHLCAAVLSRAAGIRVVAGAEYQAAGNR
jgi:pimeloyl-ACP methyl ester carboxylesterase